MIFILIFLLIILAYLNYEVFNRDLFAPPVLLSVVGVFCTLICITNYTVWELNTFGFETVLLLILATISFSVLGIFGVKLKQVTFVVGKKNYPICQNDTKSLISSYSIPKWFTVMITIISFVIALLYYIEIVNIGTIGRSMYSVKTYSLMWYVNNVDTGMQVNLLLANLTDISHIFAYIYLYVFIFNIVSQRKIRTNIQYLPPILIFAFESLLFGGRTNLLQLVTIGLVVAYYTQIIITNKPFQKVLVQYATKIVPILGLVLFIFWLLNDISGRVTSMEPLYYISVYVSSGIKNLDTFLKQVRSEGTFWGEQTFAGIYAFLSRFGLVEGYRGVALEYAPTINGLFMGNVYTAICRYYSDFGYAGVVILSGLSGFILARVYKQVKINVRNFYKYGKYNFEVFMILYGMLLYGVVTFFIEEFLFRNALSIDYLLRVMELFVVVYIMLRMKVLQRCSDN